MTELFSLLTDLFTGPVDPHTTLGFIVSAILGMVGADKMAAAQDRKTQLEMAERQRVERKAGELAKKSPTEIASMASLLKQKEQILKTNEASVQRLQASLDAIDPVIKESGTQVLNLMKGQESQFLAPVVKLRETQRAKLEGDLARRMGPGWRTTSAGIEAITKFDDQTFMSMNQVQSQALSQMSGILGGGAQLQTGIASTIDGLNRTGIAADQAILGAEGAIKQRQINAVLGSVQSTPVDFTPGEFYQGKAMADLGSQIAGMSSNVIGMMTGASLYKDMFGGGGGAAASGAGAAASAAGGGGMAMADVPYVSPNSLVDTNTYGGQVNPFA